MYELSEYGFELPKKLIAQKPLASRTGSKLLTLDRSTAELFSENFTDIKKYFEPGDVLVLNETKVMPARLFGSIEKSGKKIEILLLKETEENVWEVMVKPGRGLKVGDRITMESGASFIVQSSTENGGRIVIFEHDESLYEYIDKYGKMPLPPYIEREATEDDKARYQTVYAKIPGAVAAPTAGLHFTDDILSDLSSAGVLVVKILLHVGAGTFKPVKSESILDHKMHSEYYEISQESADIINSAKKSGKKICAVGTTAVRTLETVADENGFVKEAKGETDIFIYPGYKFKVTDRMITNFHLPKSTLILLVSAFSSIEMIKKAYDKAINENYRFYSYGDAMLIL
ncbi:MAG: tRNA preQ1(34) S-adenosylmethionine ribosyltransferase-isomerase QueA [Candidatus Delongbacteria bacterium]|nr:tRNA preQ1(34) S-adenosylmethionine ribosyltransferase-isomerase QueA [Candidatus Delongbacteria bacterium]